MVIGFAIFIAVAAVIAVVARVWAFVATKAAGDDTTHLWVDLAVRSLIFALGVANMALRSMALFWVGLAVIVVALAFEATLWRRRAPQRRQEREARERRRAEVGQILDYYQRTHAPGAAAENGTPDTAHQGS
jgi:hypothetical protein